MTTATTLIAIGLVAATITAGAVLELRERQRRRLEDLRARLALGPADPPSSAVVAIRPARTFTTAA